MNIQKIMSSLEAKHPGESEYLQAVKEVLLSIEDIYNQHPEFEKAKIIERLVEPDRIFTFRVTWVDVRTKVVFVSMLRSIFPSLNSSDSNRRSKTRLLPCLWAEVKVVRTSLHVERAMLKLCVSARHLCWNCGAI